VTIINALASFAEFLLGCDTIVNSIQINSIELLLNSFLLLILLVRLDLKFDVTLLLPKVRHLYNDFSITDSRNFTYMKTHMRTQNSRKTLNLTQY
jgi:hypothetical protein